MREPEQETHGGNLPPHRARHTLHQVKRREHEQMQRLNLLQHPSVPAPLYPFNLLGHWPAWWPFDACRCFDLKIRPLGTAFMSAMMVIHP